MFYCMLSNGEAHIGSKKYFNFRSLEVLSTTLNSNLGSVDTGTGGAVREEQKHDFDQNQDSVPSYHKINDDHETFIYTYFCA